MMINDVQNGSQYAVRKHAGELLEELSQSENLHDALMTPEEERGTMEPGFRGRVVQSMTDEFKQKRDTVMKQERQRSEEDQKKQRDRMKELLMRLVEGKDPAEVLSESDREQFDRMAELQALQAALAEFEIKWSVIMN